VEGLFEVVQCRGAAISHIPVMDRFRVADRDLSLSVQVYKHGMANEYWRPMRDACAIRSEPR